MCVCGGERERRAWLAELGLVPLPSSHIDLDLEHCLCCWPHKLPWPACLLSKDLQMVHLTLGLGHLWRLSRPKSPARSTHANDIIRSRRQIEHSFGRVSLVSYVSLGLDEFCRRWEVSPYWLRGSWLRLPNGHAVSPQTSMKTS